MGLGVEQLVKRHPGAARPALDGLSLEVGKGQVASILGRSGSGKTTLLRCLVGLERFEAGAVRVGQERHAASADGSALLGRVGLVFQTWELFPHLDVLGNCTLAPMQVAGATRAAAESKAEGWLTRLGLGSHLRASPRSLSGGQQQRVAIARALCMEPQVLLYDEPTSALDPAMKLEVGRTLRQVAESGVTQLVVTHDMAVAREASDVVFVLDGGRVAEQGSPRELFEAPKHAATAALLAHG